jgi:hypothetical protein
VRVSTLSVEDIDSENSSDSNELVINDSEENKKKEAKLKSRIIEKYINQMRLSRKNLRKPIVINQNIFKSPFILEQGKSLANQQDRINIIDLDITLLLVVTRVIKKIKI